MPDREGVELESIEGLMLPYGEEPQRDLPFVVRRGFFRQPEFVARKLAESSEQGDWDPSGRAPGRGQFTKEIYPHDHVAMFRRIEDEILSANKTVFRFQITYWHAARLNRYRVGKGGHDPHVDVAAEAKLAFSVTLKAPEKGGRLILWGAEDAEFGVGDLVIFPGYMIHEVEPVKKGERISLTGWLGGPAFT